MDGAFADAHQRPNDRHCPEVLVPFEYRSDEAGARRGQANRPPGCTDVPCNWQVREASCGQAVASRPTGHSDTIPFPWAALVIATCKSTRLSDSSLVRAPKEGDVRGVREEVVAGLQRGEVAVDLELRHLGAVLAPFVALVGDEGVEDLVAEGFAHEV